MLCASCGQENREGRRFCVQCGASLSLVCPFCGSPAEPEERFCGDCGKSLADEPSPARTLTPAPAPALPPSLAGGRYQVRGFLGEGGRKRVYLAHDSKLDRDVAVAVIKTEGLDADGLARVSREAQAMGRLGDHPHIVTVFDVSEADGAPCIVSQYMAGGALDALLREAENHRLPLDRALAICGQICQALEHAHSRGIVHRDLKPGNIWLTQDGTAKLGDFGLAVALDRSRLTMAGMMVGTASYMPPEQAMGGETTPASDLYSLGCVLYEMVTGRPPFLGDDTIAVISQHVNTAPVSPTWHNPECPPGLETLILRLLEKDPKQRPESASEVSGALASALRESTPAPTAPVATPTAGPANPIYRRTFVGREQELGQLEAAFDAALSGQGSLLMVVGEPGIGKTTLTEQLSTYVAMRGGRTLVGHCYEEGSLSLPYLPFVEAMRSHVLEHDGERLAQDLGSGAVEVARIVSEIRDRVTVELPPVGSPEEERFRLFQAVTAFLRNASGGKPLCIILEDLHDADKGTMEMLVHLGRNLAGARVLLVGTYRDVEVDRTHPLSAALAELRRAESFARIPLRGLSPAEVQRMLSNIAGQDVPFDLGEAIYRQTEGNPLFVQELVRNAAEEGLIKREGGQWVATVDSLINYIPEGLRDVIGRRLSRLSEECNRILAVAAVIGRDFAVDVLRKVAAVSEEQLLAALEEATHVSLIEEMRGQRELRYRFTHAFFRQTLYEEMIAPRRLRLHNEVAKALEAHYESRLQEHAAELFEHFSHSSTEEDLSKAVGYGELAAERAASVYAFGEAVRLLDQTLQVQDVLDPNDEAKRFELLCVLAESLLSAGEPQRVSDTVAPDAFAIAGRLNDDRRAVLASGLALLGMAYYGAGPVFTTPEWRVWCERIDHLAAPDSAERCHADSWMSWLYYGLREQQKCWELRLRSLELARRLGDAEALGVAVFNFVIGEGPLHLKAERERVAEEFANASWSGLRPSSQANFLMAAAGVLTGAGKRAAADSLLEQLDVFANRVGDPLVRAWQILGECLRMHRRGELEQAVEAGQRLVAAAPGMGIELFGQMVGAFAMMNSLRELGRFDELLELKEATQSVIAGDAAWADFLALAGRIEEAQIELRRVMAERNIGPQEDWNDPQTLVMLLSTALATGDGEAASTLSNRLAGAADWYCPQPQLTVGRLLGLAALLVGNHAKAREYLTKALDVSQRVGDRPEVARTRLALGRVLFSHYPEERAEAATHLNIASQEAQAMKMQPLLEECLALKLRFQGITSSDAMTSIDTVAREALAEQPDLKPHAAPDGTVTIMFSDVEGSTQITERLGDERWMDLLREHNAIIREQIKAHSGFEVKSEGDGFMVAFQSARKGLDCAAGIQKALHARVGAGSKPARLGEGDGDNAPTPPEPIRVRIGLHAGEVIKEGEDFFGRNVIMAARVASQAHGGEILASSVLKALVAGSDVAWGEARSAELKGLSGEHEIWPVAWS